MLYRTSLILNSALSFLFIILVFITLLTKGNNSNPPSEFWAFFILGCTLLLCFNLICFRMDRMNKDQTAVSKRLKLLGKVLFILVVLFTSIMLLGIFAVIIQPDKSVNTENSPSELSMGIVITLFALFNITAIANLIFFSKSLRRNKIIVSEFINNIGLNKQ